ncbi:MAG: molybdenum cofactor biosynthesis protein MoaD [Candidatus Thermofonsia bacterium]|nr:MAG: molybdenum cofactor biosynthesis protein MoaD [Candidatus Thermofonsia bacterium]
MAFVKFTRHLVRFFPEIEDSVKVDGRNVAEIVAALNGRYPGLADYIVDERGTLRKHVNIFVDGTMIADRHTLSDPVGEASQIHIFQALSGG